MPRRDMRCPGGCLLHRESVSTRLAGSPLLLTATRILPSIHLGSLFPLPLFGSPPVARWASLRLARSPCTTVVPLWSRGSVFSASIWSPPCRSVGLPAPCAPLLHYGWAPVAQWAILLDLLLSLRTLGPPFVPGLLALGVLLRPGRRFCSPPPMVIALSRILPTWSI